MSQNRSHEQSGQAHRTYPQIDALPTDALREILRSEMEDVDAVMDDEKTQRILYITEVIANRENYKPTKSAERAWEEFNAFYLPGEDAHDLPAPGGEPAMGPGRPETPEKASAETENTSFESIHRKKPLSFRSLRYAAMAVLALCLFCSGTAYAFGVDLWGAAARWTSYNFGFTLDPGKAGAAQVSTEGQKLCELFVQYDIDPNVVIKWLPDGFVVDAEKMTVRESDGRTAYQCGAVDGDRTVVFTVAVLTKPLSRTYEKNSENVITYEKGTVEHYIMQNIDNLEIAWKTGNYECSLSGNLTIEEAEKMIDSIYER
ncbi:MAG: DUF4367 domain-containing protein [Butyricicoccaceae bacterium]